MRTIRYDIAPLDATIDAIPPIAFSSFDPHEPAAYRTVRTEPIPIRVRPAPGSGKPTRAPAPDEGNATLLLVATGAAVAGLVLRWILGRRGEARDRPQDAGAVFRTRVAVPDADHAAALADYLAARLHCPPAAVIGPGLADRLRETGVESDLAERAARVVERLTAARYGAEDDAREAARATRELVDELERGSAG